MFQSTPAQVTPGNRPGPHKTSATLEQIPCKCCLVRRSTLFITRALPARVYLATHSPLVEDLATATCVPLPLARSFTGPEKRPPLIRPSYSHHHKETGSSRIAEEVEPHCNHR